MNLDQLAAQAAQARRAATEGARRRARSAALSPNVQAAANAARTIRFLYQVGSGFRYLWRASAPVRATLWFLVITLVGWYRRLWDRVTYISVHGVRVFRPARAGAMVFLTGAAIWYAILPVIEFCWDAPVYLLTARINESIYLRGSQELNYTSSLHSVKGCRAMPCDDADAVYFRLENDLFSNFWSLWHGRGLFFPEYVAAAVPIETTRCVVSSFGFRFRGTVRWLNYFPQLLSVSCDR